MKNKIKNLKSIIFISTLTALLFLGYSNFWPQEKAPQNMMAQGFSTPEVISLVIKKQEIHPTQNLPGRVSPYQTSEVRPQADGVIRQINFVQGSFVEAGQQLYQIDPTLYQIAYDNAKASLKAAHLKMTSYKNLLKYDAIGKQEYNDTEAAFMQAEADVRKAQTNLNYTKVLAPISGYIGKSNATEGKLVTANQAEILTTITRLSPIYVDMVLPSKEVSKLASQEETSVSLNVNNSAYEELGILKFSEVFVSETTDSVRLRAVFENKDKKLMPGMFVNANLHLPAKTVILVPQRATSIRPDNKLGLWVIDAQNKAAMRAIKAEETYQDQWIVEEGLNEGDIIVYEGYQKLTEGALVKHIPKQE
jgi:membrane fusion protein (multidrug efflux system)